MTGARETIAVYSEETIRTYGFEVQRGLVLVTLTPMAAALDLEAALEQAGIPAGHLRMATALGQPDGTLQIQVILDPGSEHGRRPPTDSDPVHAVVVREPVEVVSFQGPHYGDRYGIVVRVLDELERAGIEILTIGCTGASIYLAVDEGCADAAVSALKCSFMVPGSRTTDEPGTSS